MNKHFKIVRQHVVTLNLVLDHSGHKVATCSVVYCALLHYYYNIYNIKKRSTSHDL